MKKIAVPFILLLFIACHKKTVPVVTDRTEQPAPPVVKVDTLAHSTADIEAGNVIYTTKCIRCHAAKPVAAWTAEQWKPILKSMIPKARLDSVQKIQLTAYVNQNAKK